MLNNLVFLAPLNFACCRSAISDWVHSLVWRIHRRQVVQASIVNWAFNVCIFLIWYHYQLYRICASTVYIIFLPYSCIYIIRSSVYPSLNCFYLTTCMLILIGPTYTWSGYDKKKFMYVWLLNISEILVWYTLPRTRFTVIFTCNSLLTNWITN
jgi:hypothetical protein